MWYSTLLLVFFSPSWPPSEVVGGAPVSFLLELVCGSDWETSTDFGASDWDIAIVVLVVVSCFVVAVSGWFMDLLFLCWRSDPFAVLCGPF
jgi:hypothetical protein